MRQNGFTLIELIIAIVMISIVGSIIYGAMNPNSSVTYGANGMTETRCINGYLFVVGRSGSVQQVIGEGGGGVSCK